MPLSSRDACTVPSLLVNGLLGLGLLSRVGADGGMGLGVHLLDVLGVDAGLEIDVKLGYKVKVELLTAMYLEKCFLYFSSSSSESESM